MTYEEIVAYTKKKVAAANFKSYKGHLAAQVNITGEGEGAFYIELNDAAVAVEPYEYYDRDVILVSNADVFIAILDGKKAAQDAVAAGELRLEGNVEKALELAEALKKKAPAKKATPAKKAEAKPAAKKATPAKKAEAKPAAKKAAPAKKAEAKPATKKAAPAKKAEAKPTVKKEAPAKKAEEKPVVAKTVEKATADTKKSAVATAKKNVTKKVTK